MIRSLTRKAPGIAPLFIVGLILLTTYSSPIKNRQSKGTASFSATDAPTAVATESALAPDETKVMFKSGDDTIYGPLLIPSNAKSPMPAALLLSGSGPTDRNGNTPLIAGKVDSHKNFARVLANAGVASLRYDKLASGKTGIGSYAQRINDIGFELYVQEAISGFNFLRSRPEVDPAHMLILGHSEGGLLALVAADRLKADGPKALILAAPLSRPYLDTVREQITAQYTAAVKAKQVTQKDADTSLAELDAIIKSVLTEAKLPAKIDPPYNQLFNISTVKFLSEAGKYDPSQIAAHLSPLMPVLVMYGEKDIQVLCSDVTHLMTGFTRAGNQNASFHQLANVIHVFKEVEGAPNPNVLIDYADPSKPFSKEAAQLLTDFVKTHL